MKKRLLLLCTDLEIGGTPTVVRELALRLRLASSLHVEVACLAPRGPIADQLVESKIPMTALEARGVTDFRIFPRFVRWVHHRRFDTVLSFLVHANVVAAAARPWCPRTVRWFQSIQTTQPNPRWHWVAQAAAQFAAERIVVPSASVAQVARDWSDVPREKIVIIPNAIEPADFNPLRDSPQPHAHAAARNAFPIGFVGRLDPVKRIPDLLRAVELLEGAVHLHIHGDGEQRREIEEQIARTNIAHRVTLHGATSRVQDALRPIGILVLPSQAEGFGLVLIEAMAAGVPVIATDVPGIRDVVRNGHNGLLVPVASPPALAQAIRRLITDAPLRAALIRRGLQDVRERFSWERVIPQYLMLLR